MNGIEGIFDGDPLQVTGRNFQTQREVQVNFLDGRSGKELLEDFFVVQRSWGGVEFPIGGAALSVSVV